MASARGQKFRRYTPVIKNRVPNQIGQKYFHQ